MVDFHVENCKTVLYILKCYYEYRIVGVAANLACLLTLLIHPYMPAVSQTMMEQLNINKLWKLEKTFTCLLKPGHQIGSVSDYGACCS